MDVHSLWSLFVVLCFWWTLVLPWRSWSPGFSLSFNNIYLSNSCSTSFRTVESAVNSSSDSFPNALALIADIKLISSSRFFYAWRVILSDYLPKDGDSWPLKLFFCSDYIHFLMVWLLRPFFTSYRAICLRSFSDFLISCSISSSSTMMFSSYSGSEIPSKKLVVSGYALF